MLQSFRPLLGLGTDHRIIPGSYMPFLENQSADIYMIMLERWLRTINKIARKNKRLVDSCLLISKTSEKNVMLTSARSVLGRMRSNWHDYRKFMVLYPSATCMSPIKRKS